MTSTSRAMLARAQGGHGQRHVERVGEGVVDLQAFGRIFVALYHRSPTS
jgi:hypothetical protein